MRKLAITISGAVSLGSYEAGVLYEVFAALKSHNTACDAAGVADEKIFVDVITGASAGGMSATITAQKLLFEADQLDGADRNALYLPWVKEVSLQRLLADNASPNVGRSVLCSDVIDQIANKYLLSRYPASDTAPRPAITHPAAHTTIQVGLAMSNLNGVDYGIPTSGGGGDFLYTRFADEFVRPFSVGPQDDNRAKWEEMRQAALACGAFPFAFRLREVLRMTGEYTRPMREAFLPPDPQHFAYLDGGVFQNEPLGLAKNLVDHPAASGASPADERTYLFIAPSLRQSAIDSAFLADRANYFDAVKRLMAVIFNQARFQDWIQATRINQKIQQSRAPAMAVKDSVISGTVNQSTLNNVAAALSAVHPLPAAIAARSPLERARLKGLHKEFRELHDAVGPAAASAWIDIVDAADNVSGTAHFDYMPIDTIIAKPRELAGGALEAFAGFFREELRQYDYDLGRAKAQAVLTSPGTHLGRLRNYAPILVKPSGDWADTQPDGLDSNLREQFRDRLRQAIKELLAQSNKVNFMGRFFADMFVIKPMLNAWLDL